MIRSIDPPTSIEGKPANDVSEVDRPAQLLRFEKETSISRVTAIPKKIVYTNTAQRLNISYTLYTRSFANKRVNFGLGMLRSLEHGE